MKVKYHYDLNDLKQIVVVSNYLTQINFYAPELSLSIITTEKVSGMCKSFHFLSS